MGHPSTTKTFIFLKSSFAVRRPRGDSSGQGRNPQAVSGGLYPTIHRHHWPGSDVPVRARQIRACWWARWSRDRTSSRDLQVGDAGHGHLRSRDKHRRLEVGPVCRASRLVWTFFVHSLKIPIIHFRAYDPVPTEREPRQPRVWRGIWRDVRERPGSTSQSSHSSGGKEKWIRINFSKLSTFSDPPPNPKYSEIRLRDTFKNFLLKICWNFVFLCNFFRALFLYHFPKPQIPRCPSFAVAKTCFIYSIWKILTHMSPENYVLNLIETRRGRQTILIPASRQIVGIEHFRQAGKLPIYLVVFHIFLEISEF